MIYELYGLPGAGKTTVIKRLTGGSATSVSGSSGVKKAFIQLAKKLSLYSFSSLNYKKQMKKILSIYKDVKPSYTKTTLKHHMNNVVLVPFGYKRMHGDVYMDEGLMHRILTMAVNYKISDKDVLDLVKIFSDVMNKIDCRYLDVPVNECFESIRKRNRHECEMDEFDDRTLNSYLLDFEHYCQLVNKKYNHKRIIRNDNEEKI